MEMYIVWLVYMYFNSEYDNIRHDIPLHDICTYFVWVVGGERGVV